jgi:pyrroline-5-carboxylate reductase
MNSPISVALIGAGSMGGALLRGWLSKRVVDPKSSAIFEPSPGDAVLATGLSINPAADKVPFDAIVVAVKPQAAIDILPAYAIAARRTLVVSVMAGKSLASIGALLPGASRIVRAMPNLPAAVGAAATALYAPEGVGAGDRMIAERLMGAVGETVWVDSEAAIDAATAVSGSGPAYFFLLGEALEEAALDVGFAPDAARTLARATLAGAGAYAEKDSRSLAELRRAVTSPGGTTEAALRVLDGEDKAIRKLIKEAVRAATKRAGEMTG